MTVAPSASQAYASVDFAAARDAPGVWEDSPFDVEALHGDLIDRIAADFVVRTRAETSQSPGHFVTGPAGSGKTRLLAALRRRVWGGVGWFVSVEAASGPDFWTSAAAGFQVSLSRRMKSGRTQAGAALFGLLQRLSRNDAARAAGSGRGRNPVETLLAMLAAFAPEPASGRSDVVRALALTDSRNPEIRACAAAWMQGQAGERALLRKLGFTAAAPPPADEIVRGLTWLLGLAGPILVAVEGLDAAPDCAAGLAQWREDARRAMIVAVAREAPPSAPKYLRPARPLPPLANADMVERVLVARLSRAYAQAGFAPPYPSFPFTRAALESGVGLTPRELLARCAAHQQACQGNGGISECASLAPPPAPAAPPRLPAPLRASAPVEARPAPAASLRVVELAGLMTAPAPPTAAPAPPAAAPPRAGEPVAAAPPPSQRELTIGRSAQVGEVVGPIALSPETLQRHIAVLADAGRGGLMSRIVEEAALTGVPALVLDLQGELSRLGEPWPSRPTEFTEEDARKARIFRERVEGVVWTPGVASGRPLALEPLPDFAGLARAGGADDMDERARAAEMAVGAVEPYLASQGPKAIKMRGAFLDAFGAFARAGGGALDDFLRLLADLPAGASRIADAAALAREIAVQLVAARAVEPMLQEEGEPLDPAQFYESPNGRVRVSVIHLGGLPGEGMRAAFVNHLYVALTGWLRRQPAPRTRLLAIDEAHLFAPLRETSSARRSTLAMLAQARKYGLALMFGSREPRNLDPAILNGCLTHLYGPMGAPEQARSLAGLLAAKGAAGDEAERIRPPEYLFSGEGHPRPIRIRVPLTLSRRTLNVPSAAEIAALARRR